MIVTVCTNKSGVYIFVSVADFIVYIFVPVDLNKIKVVYECAFCLSFCRHFETLLFVFFLFIYTVRKVQSIFKVQS